MAKRLILVAAPSCCGKTTFIEQLKRGRLETVETHIEVNNLNNWLYRDIYLHEKEILELETSLQCDLILHYTIPYPALKYIFRSGYDKKERLTIIQGADELIFLTLYASPPTLLHRIQLRRQRVKERRKQGVVPIHKYTRTMRTLKRLEKIYANPNKLIPMYRNWLSYCSNLNLNKHFLVDVEASPRIEKISSWSHIIATWQSTSMKVTHNF